MLIDLTTPKIEWGNGNFKIDEDGHLTAKGGGEIAGYIITDYNLYSTSGDGVGMSSAMGQGWAF